MNKYITPKTKITVDFIDLPENNTSKNEREIKAKVAKQYGVDKTSVTVNFIAAKKNEHGKLIEIEGANIENILDENYQQQLFKEWLSREGIEINFDDILELDKKVNNDLSGEFEKSIYNKWSIEWLEFYNFLSYGPTKNRITLTDLDGLTIVSSNPRNFGGKSTALIDTLLFLLMGLTTKSSKNEDVFNKFSTEDNLYVKGKLKLGGEDVIVERSLSRKLKKDNTWNVTSNLTYKRVLADGEIVDMKEEDAIKTTHEIKKLVGTESTFNMTILATGNNLNDLINLKPTENSSVINKLIGLEMIEAKEVVARKYLNEFNKTKLSNIYKPVVLEDEISSSQDVIGILETNIKNANEEIEDSEGRLTEKKKLKDGLLKVYNKIDTNINTINLDTIKSDMLKLENEGKETSAKLKEIKDDYEKTYRDIVYDDVKYNELVKEKNELLGDISTIKGKLVFENERLENLKKDDGKCYACGTVSKEAVETLTRLKLEATEKIETLNETEMDLMGKIDKIDDGLNHLKEIETQFNEKSKVEIMISRLEINLQTIKVKYKERRADLRFYEANQEAIEKNKELDLQLGVLDTEIKVIENRLNEVKYKLQQSNIAIEKERNIVISNTEKLTKIANETTEGRMYEIYTAMVGKKGINKLVVRSLIPVINNELKRVLNGTTEFDLEVFISDKNDIEYHIVEGGVRKPARSGSGYEKTLSSLALRCVLAKVSHLPMPNFIVFDEVLGQVSPENYQLIETFFNRIKGMFDVIFLISHDERTQDWGDSSVMIEKTDKMSRVI